MRYFTKAWLIRYAALIVAYAGIQGVAGMTAQHRLDGQKAILATINPVAQRDITQSVLPPTHYKRAARPSSAQRHRTGALRKHGPRVAPRR